MVKPPEEVLKFVNMIRDEKLKELLLDLFANPGLRLSEVNVEPKPIEEGWGSRSYHHSYRGGLLDHIVACSMIGIALCKIVEEVYGCSVDRDTVLAATLVHDIYKTVVYNEEAPTRLSALGERVDHHTLLIHELIRRGFPLSVIHAVLAIHGRYGPLSPKTVEALVAHLADYLDSTLCDEVLKAARSLIKATTGREAERLTAKEAFKVVLAKQRGGWEALRRFLVVEK